MADTPTILSCLRETVGRFPEHPAVSDAERTLTYRELWREAEQYAAQKNGERGEKGERGEGWANLVETRPSVSFAVAVIGTYLAERVFVPYAKAAPADVVRQIKEELPMACGPDIADVLHTTGTTGASKGVMLSHRAAWASADNNRHFDRITEETVYLIASPLNHVSALRKLQACLLVGAHAVLMDGFVDVKRYYETIARYRVNALLLPSAAAVLLLYVSREHLHALANQIRVVHSNGAPLTETMKESLRQCLPNARLILAYGATEAGSACCAYDYAEFPGKANCVGKASPHAKISVEDGCLVVSGDSVMAGYLNDPVRTAEVLQDGRFCTHDLGRIDDDGFVYVIGRKDDIINCGGLKIAPVEVEGVAMGFKDIVDCACFGVDDAIAGQAVKLIVVPRVASRFDLAAFRGFLQEHLERHHVPTQIACVAEIPKTNGKTDRKRLRLG